MKLEELLRQKKTAIARAWVELTLDTYHVDTKRFFIKQRDPFANPVGTTIAKELESLFSELLQGIRPEEVRPCLDRIIRIRAIQDFTASQAVSFVVLLKRVVRSHLEKDLQGQDLLPELMAFEDRIDQLSLLAFEVYMACREKLYEIRADQASRRVARLLEKTGLMGEIKNWKEGPPGGDIS